MTHTFEIETRYAPVTATWHRAGRMIVVRYGDREREAQASDHDASNLFVARNIVQGWIAQDLKDE